MYPAKSTVDYNTLFVKDSTMYAEGSSFTITGGFAQDNSESENKADLVGTASYNQLIYDGVTTYTDTNENATSKNLFAGIARQGEANKSRAYVRDLNKDAGDGVTIQTNVIGGATWRHNSGGANGNIAVAVGDSKIANIYGGAVGLGSGSEIGKTEGAKENLVILDLSNNGIVTENVYGGYLSDESDGITQNNAVYVLGGEVAGSIVGGNKENTGNTLILGKDKDHLGIITAGQISNFSTLQFNAVNDTDAVLTLTDSANGADLDGVEIKFLDKGISDGAVEVVVGGNGGIGVNEKRDSGGGANAITELTKNAIKYSANLDEIAVVASGAEAKNDIVEEQTAQSKQAMA